LKCEQKRGDIRENLPLLSSACNQTKMHPFTISGETLASNSMTFLSKALEM